MTSTRRHGHTVSHVAINFTLSILPRHTQKQNFGCLGPIDVVQATDLQNQTTSFFLDLDMARSKTTKTVRAASQRLGTTRSLVVAQNKASEAAKQIAAKAAKQIFEKTKIGQKTKTKPPKPKWTYPSKGEQANAASAYRDGNLNKWDPESMKKACEQCDAQKLASWPANKLKLSLSLV